MSFKVDSTLTGIHARSEETVKVSRDFDRGRTSEQALRETFERDSKALVEVEIESEITQISDGQIRWQDFIRPFSESLTGLRSGADLSRWFDTNSFYRRPSVVNKIRTPKNLSFIQEKYTITKPLDSIPSTSKKKISIPGPYTLATLVEDKFYSSKEELIEVFAEVLSKVVGDLAKHGFKSVQINEPALVYRYGESALTNRAHLETFIESFSKNFTKPKSELYLHTYFGDCSKILPDLLELPGITGLGVDFTQTSLSDIEGRKFYDKALGCGCVDARNSLVETPEWISRFCLEALRTLKPNGLVILPSSDLKYLPRKHADEKVRSMGRAAVIVRKEVANKI